MGGAGVGGCAGVRRAEGEELLIATRRLGAALGCERSRSRPERGGGVASRGAQRRGAQLHHAFVAVLSAAPHLDGHHVRPVFAGDHPEQTELGDRQVERGSVALFDDPAEAEGRRQRAMKRVRGPRGRYLPRQTPAADETKGSVGKEWLTCA